MSSSPPTGAGRPDQDALSERAFSAAAFGAVALDAVVFDAVIFDNDGTLIDSTPAVDRSWARWATERDIPQHRLRGFHGVPALAIATELVPAYDLADAVARIHELELADLDDVVALPGASGALAALGELCAIATSATRALALHRLRAAGLQHPPVLVTADDVTRGKPDPEPYLLAAKRLAVDPARCLVVEDAPAGIAAARAAGCATLAVTTTTPAAELPADATVETLAQVHWEVADDGIRVRPIAAGDES
jgi:sugar-phosphatase